MNRGALASPSWSRRKWWGVGAALFILHLLLLLLFGGRGPVPRRPAVPAPQLQFAHPHAAEWLALTDPTLFAQGHPHGFSGASWMKSVFPFTNPQPEWTEAPRFLALNAHQLGAEFRRFIQTNLPPTPVFVLKPTPAPASAAPPGLPATSRRPSTLRIEGALATRAWLDPPPLPAQQADDLLTNSVVQVLVNGDGHVLSEVLLSGSGLPTADALALTLARKARFAPLPRTDGGRTAALALVSGLLIFEWQTLPLTTPSPAP